MVDPDERALNAANFNDGFLVDVDCPPASPPLLPPSPPHPGDALLLWIEDKLVTDVVVVDVDVAVLLPAVCSFACRS